VQGPGDELLSGAGLAADEDGGVGARDAGDELEDRAHRVGSRDHPVEEGEPRGFGDRHTVLHNLLRGAGRFEAVRGTAEGLAAIVREQDAALVAGAAGAPALVPLVAPWCRRAGETLAALDRLAGVAGAAP